MQGTKTHARVVSSTGAHAARVRSASLTDRRQVSFLLRPLRGSVCATCAHAASPQGLVIEGCQGPQHGAQHGQPGCSSWRDVKQGHYEACPDKDLDIYAPTHCLTLENIPSIKDNPWHARRACCPARSPARESSASMHLPGTGGNPRHESLAEPDVTACLHGHISSTKQNRTHVAGLHSPCFAVSTPRHLLHCRSLRSRSAPPDQVLQRGSTPHHRGHTHGRRTTLNPPPCRRAAALRSRLTPRRSTTTAHWGGSARTRQLQNPDAAMPCRKTITESQPWTAKCVPASPCLGSRPTARAWAGGKRPSTTVTLALCCERAPHPPMTPRLCVNFAGPHTSRPGGSKLPHSPCTSTTQYCPPAQAQLSPLSLALQAHLGAYPSPRLLTNWGCLPAMRRGSPSQGAEGTLAKT